MMNHAEQNIQSDGNKSLSAFGTLSNFFRELQKNPALLDYFGERELNFAALAYEVARQRTPMPTLKLKIAEPILARLPYSYQCDFADQLFKGCDNMFAVRKVMIKEAIEKAITEGATQIVLLRGGYDGRGLFSSEKYPEVQFFEVDKGPTMEVKKEIISTFQKGAVEENEHFMEVRSNYRIGECDLTTSELPDKLEKMGYQKDQKTLAIAEGFSMYVSQQANIHNAQQLRTLFDHPESEFLTSYGVDPKSTLNAESLVANNEGHKFYIDFDEVPQFVHSIGWSVQSRFSAQTWRKLMHSDLQTVYNDYKDIPELYVKIKPRKVVETKHEPDVDDAGDTKPEPEKGNVPKMEDIPEMQLPAFQEDSDIAKEVAMQNRRVSQGFTLQYRSAPAQLPKEQPQAQNKRSFTCQIL